VNNVNDNSRSGLGTELSVRCGTLVQGKTVFAYRIRLLFTSALRGSARGRRGEEGESWTSNVVGGVG